MKILIVFLGFIVIFSGFIVFNTDCSNYLDLQRYLKALAEECARDGALMNSNSAGADKYVISLDDANSCKNFVLQKNRANIAPLSRGSVSVVLTKVSDTAIKAEASWTPEDGYKLFRLGLGFDKDIVSQSSMYELLFTEY